MKTRWYIWWFCFVLWLVIEAFLWGLHYGDEVGVAFLMFVEMGFLGVFVLFVLALLFAIP